MSDPKAAMALARLHQEDLRALASNGRARPVRRGHGPAATAGPPKTRLRRPVHQLERRAGAVFVGLGRRLLGPEDFALRALEVLGVSSEATQA